MSFEGKGVCHWLSQLSSCTDSESKLHCERVVKTGHFACSMCLQTSGVRPLGTDIYVQNLVCAEK
jgi:hypothetical protein